MCVTNFLTGVYQGFSLIEYFSTFTGRVGVTSQLVIR